MTKPVNFEWLQGRVTDLEAEVENQGRALYEHDEALRRVVEAGLRVYGCWQNDGRIHGSNPRFEKDMDAALHEFTKALAFAKGVMGARPDEGELQHHYWNKLTDADRGGEERG